MRRSIALGAAAVAVVLAAAAANSIFVLGQGQEAVVLRLGRPVAVVNASGDDAPGLKVKAPFVDTLVRLDKREQLLEADHADLVAADQTALSVDGLLRYRITNPIRFYRALGDAAAASGRLQELTRASLQTALAGAPLAEIAGVQRAPLTARASVEAARSAQARRLGIRVERVDVLRTTLSAAAAAAVYQRMQTEMAQQAAQYRAGGEQQTREITGEADKEAATLRGTANANADRIRGDGDARRAAILSQAYGRDPEFAMFQRSLQAYQATLGHGDTTLVISAASPFLKALTDGPGAGR